jgi:hypothetical protein
MLAIDVREDHNKTEVKRMRGIELHNINPIVDDPHALRIPRVLRNIRVLTAGFARVIGALPYDAGCGLQLVYGGPPFAFGPLRQNLARVKGRIACSPV